MNTYVRKAWRLSWLLMLALQCFADTLRVEQAEPRLDVTVYVFNYAEVPGGTLARAQAVAARIFGEVGVKLAWSRAPVSAADTARGVHLKPTDVVLRILPRSMAESLGFPPNTFGFAFPEKRGGIWYAHEYLLPPGERIKRRPRVRSGPDVGPPHGARNRPPVSRDRQPLRSRHHAHSVAYQAVGPRRQPESAFHIGPSQTDTGAGS